MAEKVPVTRLIEGSGRAITTPLNVLLPPLEGVEAEEHLRDVRADQSSIEKTTKYVEATSENVIGLGTQ